MTGDTIGAVFVAALAAFALLGSEIYLPVLVSWAEAFK